MPQKFPSEGSVVAAFNQEKALVGAFSVITNLRMELFEALVVDVKVYVMRMTIFAGRATGRSTSTLHRRGFLDTGRDVMEEGVAVSQVT